MSVLIETGDSLYGCVAVLHGHDLALCTRHHLENAVEAATGLSPSLQRFFFKNKKILTTSSLSKQGLALGDRLFLHVAGKGGMPHADSPVLEEYYADSDAEKCGVVDSISECVFSDPVFSSKSGHTFSRSTLVQNNMNDPVFRERLTDDMVIPNRNKAGEVEQYLDRRLKDDISTLERSNLRDHDSCTKLLSLVAMVARRSDLTACLNAKRLLTEVLSAQSSTTLHSVVAMATEAQVRNLLALARACDAEKLEAKLLDAQRSGSAASASMTSSSSRPPASISLYNPVAGFGSGGAAAGGVESDSEWSDSDDFDSFSDTSSVASVASVSSLASNTSSTAGAAASGSATAEKTTLRIKSVAPGVTAKDLHAVFSMYKPYILGINIIEPGQQRGRQPGKKRITQRFALVVFSRLSAAREARKSCNGKVVGGECLLLSLQRKKAKEDSADAEPKTANKSKRTKKSKDKSVDEVPVAAPAAEAPAKRTESVSVKVNRVHPSVSKDLLQSVFRKYGTITSLNLILGDGKGLTYAYVNYSQPAEAKRACDKMNGVGLNGSKLQCLLKKPQGSSSSSTSSPMATNISVRVFPVKVANLEEDVTEEDLEEKFSEFGEIANMDVKTTGSSHFAFINFYSEMAQKSASSSLHQTKFRKRVISVVMREERTIAVQDHPTKGLTPTSATPPSPVATTYMSPGTVVSADGKVKSTGRKTSAGPLPSSPPRPLMPDPPMPLMSRGAPPRFPPLGHSGPGHPGPGHPGLGHSGPGHPGPGHPGLGHPGQGHPPQGHPGLGHPGPGHPPMGFAGPHHSGPSPPMPAFPTHPPPAPVVNTISASAFQAIVAMPTMLAPEVERKIQSHTDFHKSQGTYTSYKQATGEFVVHGKDAQSVEFIAKEAYDAFLTLLQAHGHQHSSMPPPVQRLPSQPTKPDSGSLPYSQQFPSSSQEPYKQSVSLPVESHLMHFLLHRRGNLVEKLNEKFPDVAVGGFVKESTCLEFTGAECVEAMDFTKARYQGYQCEEMSLLTPLVESACHVGRTNDAVIYVTPGNERRPLPSTTLTICALGRKPIDKIKAVLDSPQSVVVDVPKGLLAELKAHPTCSLTELRADLHVSYTVQREDNCVVLQGFVADDLQAAADRLHEFVKSRRALEKAKTANLKCSDVAMRFLNHALHTLEDVNAKIVIEQIENKHGVTVGRNETKRITITGIPSSIEAAQKEIMEGPLLGSFKFRRHELTDTRQSFMKLIQRCGLNKIESDFRVICFMHYDVRSGRPPGPRRDGSASSARDGGRERGQRATQGSIVIELCGIIEEEVEKASQPLKEISVTSRHKRIVSDPDFEFLDQWQRNGRLSKIRDDVDLVVDRKTKMLFCNALSENAAKEGLADALDVVTKHRREHVALDLDAAVRQFIKTKRRDWLGDVEGTHNVKVNVEGDTWHVVGLKDDVEQVKQKLKDLLMFCPIRAVTLAQKQRKLHRHILARCVELRTEVEDSLDATILVPTLSNGDRGDRGGYRGRGRGGGRGRSSDRRGDHHRGDEGAAEPEDFVVQCIAGGDDALGQVVAKVMEIEQALTHIRLPHIGEQNGSLIIEGIKAKRIQAHLYRGDVNVNKGTVHINALSREEAEQLRDIVQEFTIAKETVQVQLPFPSVSVGNLIRASEMPRIYGAAKRLGVHVTRVRDEHHSAAGSLAVSGDREAVDRFREELSQIVDAVAATIKSVQVSARGLEATVLRDCSGEISALERKHGVSCTWTTPPALSRATAGRHGDGNDADALQDDDDGALDGAMTTGSPSAAATADAADDFDPSSARNLAATALSAGIDLAQKKYSRSGSGGFLSTLSTFFTRQSSSGSSTKPPTASPVPAWEWQDERGWKPYSAAMSAEIDKCALRGTKCTLPVGTTRYSIDPVNKIQTNQTTGFARAIRHNTSSMSSANTLAALNVADGSRVAGVPPTTASAALGQWQFQDETGAFTNYSPSKNAVLEQHYSQGRTVFSFTRGSYLYQVDLSDMTQTNMSTSKKRLIRRVGATSGAQAAGDRAAAVAVAPGDEASSFPTSFSPVASGKLPASVSVTVEGQASSLDTAVAALKHILSKSMCEKTVLVPIKFSACLSKQLEKIATMQVVSVEMKSGVSSSSGEAKPSNNTVLVQGSRRRVDTSVDRIQNLLLKSVSEATPSRAAVAECPHPKEWEAQSQDLELKDVLAGTSEYNQVRSQVHMSLASANILRIQRIQNKFLWKKYNQTKDVIREKIGQVPEKLLFHGTRSNPPEKIYRSEEGFDMRFSSSGMWGQANYFATESRYSHSYCHTPGTKCPLTGEPDRQMILAKVIVGDSVEMQASSSLRMPPVKQGVASTTLGEVRYDTVNGVTNGTRVYMVYRNSQAYPFYLLTYRTG